MFLAHFHKKRNDYLLYVNVMLPYSKGIKHFVFKTQTNFPTRTDLPSQQKNAHFHTYIRMGLYIRMCDSIRAYAQAYTDVCGFLRDLTHEIPHVRPKNRMFFLNIKGFKIKITAF